MQVMQQPLHHLLSFAWNAFASVARRFRRDDPDEYGAVDT
jgi:hypothetical protein